MTYVLERMKQASSMSSSASSALLSNGLNGKAMGGKPAMNKVEKQYEVFFSFFIKFFENKLC